VTSWDESIHHTAAALAELMTDRGDHGHRQVAFDLDVAVTARAAVLAGIANVLRDLAPRTMHGAPQGRRPVLLAMAEVDPLRALGQVLRGRARPALDRSPSELLDGSRPVGPTTELWASAGRHALIADQIWSAVPRHLEGEHAWHVVSQIASLAVAIAVLDTELAAAAAGHRPDVTAVLATTTGLRLAARETRTLTVRPGHGTVASGAPPRPIIAGPAALTVVSPATAADLPRAAHRLTTILRATDVLTPRQVRATATVARDLCIIAAASATDSHGQDLRQELGGIARPLHAVAIGNDGESCLVPTAAPALELQLRELRLCTRSSQANRDAAPEPADATRLAQRIPTLVEALATRTEAQLTDRRWAVPERTERTTLPHAVADVGDPDRRPALVPQLRDAATATAALRERTGVPALRPAELARGFAGAASEMLNRGTHRSDADRARAPHPANPPARGPIPQM
jgi:hypothetical protein